MTFNSLISHKVPQCDKIKLTASHDLTYHTHSNHRYMNHIRMKERMRVQGIGNRNSCMNIRSPITVCIYLSTITAAFFPSSPSFKYLLCGMQIVKTLTYMMTLLFSNTIRPQLYAPVKYNLHTQGITSIKTPAHDNKDPGQWEYLQFSLKHEVIPYGSKFPRENIFVNFGNSLSITKSTKILALKILVPMHMKVFIFINIFSQED